MNAPRLRVTYVGGPTALLESGGLRLLTDPTFDPAGESYTTPVYTLRKTQAPALTPEAVGAVDAVLLSHDHHFDNLDRAGCAFLPRARRVLTTVAGAERLGGSAVGLEPWHSRDIPAADGRVLRVTATPARHGPAHADRGPVVGFLLQRADEPSAPAVYISGDTVWYEGVADVARRSPVFVALLFTGAARVSAVGPWHLTMTAAEAVEAARAFARAAIVPLHFEGWEHFSESRGELEQAFAAAGMNDRLHLLEPGGVVEFSG
jgi:L-ascorbate metabolism protein UlaG (beta-lactamase superfamily)